MDGNGGNPAATSYYTTGSKAPTTASTEYTAVIPFGCAIVLGGQSTCIQWIYGFNGLSGGYVDAKGNIFVVESGSSAVNEILAVNGACTVSHR